ncbi:MAG: cytochrome c [Blastocatellia bacterium]|nr:cytochrome c [Blastocatellia bacterium]
MNPKKFTIITLIATSGLVALIALTATSRASSNGQKEVTFTRDVVPIFYKNCAACHRPDDLAPFSVLTYEDARPWARSIKEKVVSREMPPWHADPRYGDFINDARLSRRDIDTVAAWVDQGAKEGDPRDLPPLPDYAAGWNIGKPDQILSMTREYVIEPDAPDNYVYFTLPVRFSEDKWIQAAEIRPGNKRVVHHAIAHILTPRARARAGEDIDETDGEPDSGSSIFYKSRSLSRVLTFAPVIDDGASAPNGGSAFKRRSGHEDADGFSILLTSFAPGKAPDIYAEGTAKKIPAGSVIVLQIHYSSFRGALEKPERDRTSLGLIFAKEPPRKRVVSLTIPNHYFKIPAGSANHRVSASYTFDQDAELINYMPHMHLRGKDMKYEALYPDDRRETLLWVPRFNFNWQTLYRLREPVAIPKGTKIIVTAHFDNSSKNKYNPDPTRDVRWGDPTYDEMMIGWMDYALPESSK